MGHPYQISMFGNPRIIPPPSLPLTRSNENQRKCLASPATKQQIKLIDDDIKRIDKEIAALNKQIENKRAGGAIKDYMLMHNVQERQYIQGLMNQVTWLEQDKKAHYETLRKIDEDCEQLNQ